MAEKNKRGRNWTFIVYPDSAPKDWREVLDGYHVPWIESPEHDKDTNPDGTIKKAHWHVLMIFDGNKSFKQIEQITSLVNSPIPQRVESARGLVRYMVHLDNPEKYQYSRSDIIGHAGADVDKYFEMTTTNRLDTLKDITNYVLENHISSFSDLVQYSIETDDDWFTVVADKNTLFLNKLIDSEWKKKHKNRYEN